MEASALTKTQLSGLRGPSPLLRLAPDERLIALVRRGQSAAFETIVGRYQTRLLAFCRHLLASREDAEDVLQEVFAAAFNAMVADRREINLRPWLYRIARNRCLNHLRKQTAIGVDSMDVHFADSGASTVEKAAGRENFRLLMADIRRLPETQRTALLLREMDALSYDQIAEAMETTVPGVKSLLVRARISLGEAAEARKLTCAEVRLELGAIAEGIGSASPAIRRHVKDCERCHDFRAHLRANNRAMAAMLPVGPLLLLKKFALAKLGVTVGAGSASATAGSSGAVGAAGAAGAGGAAGAAGATGAGAAGVAGGATGAGALTAGALATKAVAGLAAAALVTAGAVEVHQTPRRTRPSRPAITQRHVAVAPVRTPAPAVIVAAAQPTTTEVQVPSAAELAAKQADAMQAHAKPAIAASPVIQIAPPVELTPVDPTPMIPTAIQQVSNVSVLPPQPGASQPTATGLPAAVGAAEPTTPASATIPSASASAPPTTPPTGLQAAGQTQTPALPSQPTASQPTASQPTAAQPTASQPSPAQTTTVVTSTQPAGATTVTTAGGPPAGQAAPPTTPATQPAPPVGSQASTGPTQTPGTSGSAGQSATTMTEILGGAVVTTPSRRTRHARSRTHR